MTIRGLVRFAIAGAIDKVLFHQNCKILAEKFNI